MWFQVARAQGSGEVAAYLWSMIGPLLGLAFQFLRNRRIDGVGVIVAVIILTSAVLAAVGGTDPRMLLLKDSAGLPERSGCSR